MPYTRRFVLACLGAASGLPLLARSSRASVAVDGSGLSAATLRALVADPLRARILGLSYRAQFPAEDHPSILTRLIGASLLADAGAAALNSNTLPRVLDARVRSEFAAGDIVRVAGWVVARTEARLCALCE